MDQLLDRFRERVYRLCLRMLGQHQDAEDMAQETFVRAFRSLHTWDSGREFEPWLLTIAGNRCRTHITSRGRRPIPHEFVEDVADKTISWEERNSISEEVRLAFSRLKPHLHQAFTLFHEEQLSYQEIASVMNCPLGTVKTWVYRARRDLIEHLQKRGVYQGEQNIV